LANKSITLYNIKLLLLTQLYLPTGSYKQKLFTGRLHKICNKNTQ